MNTEYSEEREIMNNRCSDMLISLKSQEAHTNRAYPGFINRKRHRIMMLSLTFLAFHKVYNIFSSLLCGQNFVLVTLNFNLHCHVAKYHVCISILSGLDIGVIRFLQNHSSL